MNTSQPGELTDNLPSQDTVSLSAREVADRTGLSLRLIQFWARQGAIPGAFQPPPGLRARWRFRRTEFEKW